MLLSCLLNHNESVKVNFLRTMNVTVAVRAVYSWVSRAGITLNGGSAGRRAMFPIEKHKFPAGRARRAGQNSCFSIGNTALCSVYWRAFCSNISHSRNTPTIYNKTSASVGLQPFSYSRSLQ